MTSKHNFSFWGVDQFGSKRKWTEKQKRVKPGEAIHN